jgi:hypothetical protein
MKPNAGGEATGCLSAFGIRVENRSLTVTAQKLAR